MSEKKPKRNYKPTRPHRDDVEEEEPDVPPRAIKPGDSPNKFAAMGRKPRPGAPKNAQISVKPVIESIDPLPPSQVGFNVQGINDIRTPGQPEVGKIYLRHQVFEEINDLAVSTVESARNLVHLRVDFPQLTEKVSFVTSLSLSYQMFNTLELNSTAGPNRKLKVMRMSRFNVPDFLPPLTSVFGNFTTSEGLIRVALIEQLVPNLAYSALRQYNRIEGVRPLPNFHDTDDWMLYDSTSYREDLYDLVDVLHPQLFQPLRFIVAAARQVPVTVDYRNGDRLDLLELIDNPAFDIDDGDRIRLRSFLTIRDLPYHEYQEQAHRQHFNVLEIVHGSTMPIEQLAEWLNIAIPEYQRAAYRALETVFACSPFTPTRSGTASQCVVGDEQTTIDSFRCKHTFSLAPTSAAIGFILMPARRVEFSPGYDMFSINTRFQHIIRIADKFVNPNLRD